MSAAGPSTTSTTIFHLERRSYARGDCGTFDQQPGQDTRETHVVNCDRSQSHLWEVAGYADLTGKVAQPPAVNDDPAWGLLVGDACHVAAAGYLGHEPRNDQRAGWEPIEPGSWAAGRRTVECTVARYRGNQDVPAVGR